MRIRWPPVSRMARLAAFAIDWPIPAFSPLSGTSTATRLRSVSVGRPGVGSGVGVGTGSGGAGRGLGTIWQPALTRVRPANAASPTQASRSGGGVLRADNVPPDYHSPTPAPP